MSMQFKKDNNCKAHRRGTGLETVEALGQVNFLVAGVGSDGSLTGCGEVIKAHCPDCRIVAVDSVDSPVISGVPAATVFRASAPGLFRPS